MTTANDVQHMTIERFLAADSQSKLTPEEQAVFIAYLREFAIFDNCVGKCRCGAGLLGILGTFEWGLVHGEGFCGSCYWPARGAHRIEVGREHPAFFEVPLPYHPDFVEVSP